MAVERYLTVAGAGGKTGVDWDNAYSNAEFQAMLDELVLGSTGHIEEGTYTQAATLDIDTNSGTDANNIALIGYDAATHTAGAGRWTIDGNSAATYGLYVNNRQYWSIRNFAVINAVSDGVRFQPNSFWVGLFDYEISSCGGKGVNGNGNNTQTSTFSAGSLFNNTGDGIQASLYVPIVNHLIFNNGANGISSSIYSCILHSIIHNNTSTGISGGRFVYDCIIDGNTTGISGGASEANMCYENNRITHNTTGFSVNAAVLLRNNFFYNNATKLGGTGEYIDVGDNIDGASDGYADRGNDNFTLAGDGDGVRVEIAIGSKDGATNKGFFTQGIPPQGGGGGGRLVGSDVLVG